MLRKIDTRGTYPSPEATFVHALLLLGNVSARVVHCQNPNPGSLFIWRVTVAKPRCPPTCGPLLLCSILCRLDEVDALRGARRRVPEVGQVLACGPDPARSEAGSGRDESLRVWGPVGRHPRRQPQTRRLTSTNGSHLAVGVASCVSGVLPRRPHSAPGSPVCPQTPVLLRMRPPGRKNCARMSKISRFDYQCVTFVPAAVYMPRMLSRVSGNEHGVVTRTAVMAPASIAQEEQ